MKRHVGSAPGPADPETPGPEWSAMGGAEGRLADWNSTHTRITYVTNFIHPHALASFPPLYRLPFPRLSHSPRTALSTCCSALISLASCKSHPHHLLTHSVPLAGRRHCWSILISSRATPLTLTLPARPSALPSQNSTDTPYPPIAPDTTPSQIHPPIV